MKFFCYVSKGGDKLRSCKNCKGYEAARGKIYKGFCKSYGRIKILQTLQAQYCEDYQEKRELPKGEIKCCNCKRINEYGWCTKKKRCFNEKEREQERTCINYSKSSPIQMHTIRKLNKKKSCNDSRHG